MNIKQLTVIAALVLATQTLFAGQVYKWVDEQGQIHYSDKKPNNVDSTKFKVSGGKQTSTRVSVQEKSTALEEQKQKELEQKAEALKATSQKKVQEAQCKTIRDNLQKLEETARIKVDENGEQRYLTPDEIEQTKARYRNQLSEFCQ